MPQPRSFADAEVELVIRDRMLGRMDVSPEAVLAAVEMERIRSASYREMADLYDRPGEPDDLSSPRLPDRHQTPAEPPATENLPPG